MPTVVEETSMFERRKARVLRSMAESEIDVLVVSTPASVLYLTGIDLGGFWSPQYVVLAANGDHRYVVRGIEIYWRDKWSSVSWCTNWVPYADDQDPTTILAGSIRDLAGSGSPRLALELNRSSMPYQVVEDLTRDCAPSEVTCSTDLVEGQRVIKESAEVELIRSAGRITAAGMKAAADTIRDGGIDSAASSAAFVAMLANGSEFLADNPFVAIGPESAMAHARATNRRPKPGEVVPIMMSASVHRYQCPVERTYTFGAPPKELERSLSTVCDAVEAAIDTIQPGMRSFEADAVVREVYERADLSRYFLNRLGYSFGLAYPPVWWENEIMQLRPGDNRVIEEGMVFHLVPALHIPGQGFLNRSMPIVITSDGCEPLIDLPVRVEPL